MTWECLLYLLSGLCVFALHHLVLISCNSFASKELFTQLNLKSGSFIELEVKVEPKHQCWVGVVFSGAEPRMS